MTRRVIHSPRAPSAEGKPFSHGVTTRNGLIITSGALGMDPETGQLVEGSFEDEVHQSLHNVLAVVRDAGGTPEDVLRTTVYLTDLDTQYEPLNTVYRETFREPLPARAAVEVSSLAKGGRVEIDAVAEHPEDGLFSNLFSLFKPT